MENMGNEAMKLWKASWEGYVGTLRSVQEQNEKMFDLFLRQTDTIRQEAAKALKEGMAVTRQAQDTYLEAVDESMKRCEELFGAKE